MSQPSTTQQGELEDRLRLLRRGRQLEVFTVPAALDSRALHADSIQTDICMILSAILLLGLGLNAALGWWWADPIAGVAMVPLIAREGVHALRGERCEELPEMAGLG